MKKTKTKTKKERKATKRVFRQERSLSSFRHITTAFSVLVVVFTSFVSRERALPSRAAASFEIIDMK